MEAWTAIVQLIRDVGFPAAVALYVLRDLGAELRAIRGRLDDLIRLNGGQARRQTGPPADG